MPTWLMGLMSLLGFGYDTSKQNEQNALAAGREQDTNQNVAAGQAGVTQAAMTMPSFYYGNHIYRPPGAPTVGGPRPIDLNAAFNSGNDALAAFDQGSKNLDTQVDPLNMDFSGLEGKAQANLAGTGSAIHNILQGATLAPGTLAGQVDMPNTDLSSILAADIAGQGTASQGRLNAQRTSLASAAPQFGGLEGVSRENRSLDFSEGANRAGQAVQSTAANRAQEAQLQEFVANLQGQLGMKEADINAMLAGQGAGVAAQLGLRESQIPFEAGQLNLQGELANRSVQEGNINRGLDLFRQRVGLVGVQGQEDTQKLMTALDLLLKQSGATQGAAGSILSSDLGLGQIMQPGMQQNTVSLQNAINNLMTALSAQNAQGQSQKGSFNLMMAGFGGGAGCIAGCMPVMTLQGLCPLSEVKIGQLVMGKDGGYHRVHDKEYGKVELADRKFKHLILVTDKSYIWLTENHPVSGKPAGEWKEGEKMAWQGEDGMEETTLLHVFPAPYVHSGDLLLDGGHDYMVMGFPVSSVIKGA